MLLFTAAVVAVFVIFVVVIFLAASDIIEFDLVDQREQANKQAGANKRRRASAAREKARLADGFPIQKASLHLELNELAACRGEVARVAFPLSVPFQQSPGAVCRLLSLSF